MLASAYHPHKGGVEEIVRQLARRYRHMGHRVLVVAPRWPRALPAAEVVDGQLVRRVPMPLPSRLHLRSAASFVLKFLPSALTTLYIGWRWRPDVMQVQCVGPNGLYALILSSVLRLPLIVTSYGEQTVDAGGVYERSATQRWVLRRLLRRADAVTADSAYALHNLAPYGFSFPNGVVIHNGIDPTEFIQASPVSPQPRPYIFAIGRHVRTKGFDILLRAYTRLVAHSPDVDLVIAGDGPEHQNLIALAAQLGVAHRVVFLGRTDRATTATYFAHCRFVVLPSRRESFPVVNLEAMAAGKAVVATSVGGVTELVREGENGLLVPPADVDALAVAMRRLLGDPHYAAALAAAGARQVRDHHSWETVAASSLMLYEHVLSLRRAPKTSHTATPSEAKRV